MENILPIANLVMATAAALLSLPVAVICLEVWSALKSKQTRHHKTSRKTEIFNLPIGQNVAVLIPAHNEESILEGTLRSLMPTLPPGARLVLVADNCTDQTASIARQWGAEVVERQDLLNRGKGFALEAGLRYLANAPPQVVVFLDADCRVAPETVKLLGEAALVGGRPAQGLNLCPAEADAPWQQRVASFAFQFRNQVRARGLFSGVGLCHLTGTGMALPWSLADRIRPQGSHLAEDMQWGIDLAIAGFPPQFVEEALVTSPLPRQPEAIRSQRTRWEHGHLRTLLSQVPRLLRLALHHRRWDLAALALDLAVPPLGMLVMTLGVASTVAFGLWMLGGSGLPLVVLTTDLAAFCGAVGLAWSRMGRKELPFRTLLLAPVYALVKLPIYWTFLFRRQQAWVRTPREQVVSHGSQLSLKG